MVTKGITVSGTKQKSETELFFRSLLHFFLSIKEKMSSLFISQSPYTPEDKQLIDLGCSIASLTRQMLEKKV